MAGRPPRSRPPRAALRKHLAANRSLPGVGAHAQRTLPPNAPLQSSLRLRLTGLPTLLQEDAPRASGHSPQGEQLIPQHREP